MLVRWAAVVTALLLVAMPAGCRPGSARAEEAPEFLDPALLPAWALLRGVEVAGGRPLGAELADARERAGVRLAVGLLNRRDYAEYHIDEASIVISDAIVEEDRRALAAVLAHELTHVQQGLQGLLDEGNCAMNEAWAFVYEADIWEALTGGDMPTRTRLEADLTQNAALVSQSRTPPWSVKRVC
jgi:hypothetical protein